MGRSPSWALAAFGLMCSQFISCGTAAASAQPRVSVNDNRPVQSILILGNSRTYYNDMPAMLRQIMESARGPFRFIVETHLGPSYSFKRQWSHPHTRSLLSATYDSIILQGESRAQSKRTMHEASTNMERS